ncbi:acyltransferase family protein [Luteimonas kalidii]|uniref:Acyltransferase family protein n=1 Tax=Luteimonas kalidii TaxID=3042025 RepID=A0ABT6JQF0_9GAMM|nr:acyltransferase family protein [Luteimonas kalidii]MDH5832847.1 acyltransferase family protein [Luteimonas kalidii]
MSHYRPEIQGLRAIAVLAVLIFHIWPSALPGGYVGVDVFFVISGFLITGILLRQAEKHGSIDILGFYAKRIKRLLPAATLVLLTVAICISLLPMTQWNDAANEIAASALYVENWWLAAQAIDYLAAENAPSPLQHYWSLSVEEQYYIVWPLLFLLFGTLLRRSRATVRVTFRTIIVVIGAASLCYSVYLTPKSPGLAYFATTTRAWELALGGALAVFTFWERGTIGLRVALGWLGLAMIGAAAFTFNENTAFPGYTALLPTLGATLLIAAGCQNGILSSSRLLTNRPMQYIGDLSYSLYLWHWPVIVFYQAMVGRTLGLVDGVVVAGVSFALAHQSKQLIEDFFRRPDVLSGRWRPVALAAACIALSLFCWLSIKYQVERHEKSRPPKMVQAGNYPGALALTDGFTVQASDPRPHPLLAKDDKGDPYSDGCIASLLRDEVKECVYGQDRKGPRLVIVGDSHAVHWVPALQVVAEHSDARLVAITKSACAVTDLEIHHDLEQYRSCMAWSLEVIEWLRRERPDVVLFAHSKSSLSKIAGSREQSGAMLAASFTRVWASLEEIGIDVVALKDTPSFSVQVPDCLSSTSSPEDCRVERSRAFGRIDPLVLAVEAHPSVKLIDLSDAICNREFCSPIVGNVVAWRDAHHMTATFARTLAPALSRHLAPKLREVPVDSVLGERAADDPRK